MHGISQGKPTIHFISYPLGPATQIKNAFTICYLQLLKWQVAGIVSAPGSLKEEKRYIKITPHSCTCVSLTIWSRLHYNSERRKQLVGAQSQTVQIKPLYSSNGPIKCNKIPEIFNHVVCLVFPMCNSRSTTRKMRIHDFETELKSTS